MLLATTLVSAAVLQLAAADSENHSRLRSHATSTLFDKPTPHPTTVDYNPYHWANFGSNLEHQHQYFYEWPHQSHSTYSPTASPTSDSMIPTVDSVIPTYSPTPSPQISSSRPTSDSPTPIPTRTSSPSDSWNVLAQQDFLDGFGVFQEVESQDTVHHYSSKLGRQGVIQLQKSATLPSYDIAVDSYQNSSQLKVEFSFYTDSMNVGDGFCLEYSLNDETDWNPVRCWQSSIDFENNKWNDDFNAEFALDDRIQVDSLRIKFVSIASRDNVDVMLDRISLLQR